MSRHLRKTILFAVVFLGLATAAWAFWTTSGAGSASAGVGTLNAPTNVSPSASAGSSTVSVSWTGSTLSNGTPAQGYYVTRTNASTSSTSAACGSSVSSLISGTSCSDTSVSDGTYTYEVTAVYHTWTAASAAGNQVTVQGDNTPPTVQSINRHTGSPTNASSVQFDVTFSESVSGVDLADFALATTGVTGAAKTSISGSGASYTVTVNTGSGDGTVGLNLVDDDSITDGASNKLGGTGTSGAGDGSFTGQVYAIDKTAPTVQSINRQTSSPTNAASVQFDVTFTESVSGVDLSDFALATTGVTGASKTSISGSGASYTVTVNTGSGDGTVGLNLVDDDSIQDGLGQKLGGTGTGNGNFTGQTYTVDKTAPTRTALEFFDANGNGKVDQVKVTYNETLGSYTAGTSPWTLTAVPSGGSLASVSVGGSVVTLDLTEGAGAADTSVGTFKVAYTAPGSGGVADAAGTNAASFAATAPTDKAAPALTLLEMFDTDFDGRINQVAATFSETLVSSTATAPWTLTSVPSGGTLASVSTSGAVATLTITEGASAADTSVGSFTVALAASGTGIRDSATNQSSFTAQAPGDKAGPVPVSLTDSNINLDGKFELSDTMTVTFTENVIGVAASSNVSLVGGNGGNNDSVSMSNLLLGSPSLGRSDYMNGNGTTANFNTSGLSQPALNQVQVTLAACTGTGTACTTSLRQAAAAGSFTFTPVTTITDAATNAAAGSITVSIRLF